MIARGIPCPAREDEAVLVEAVAAEHAADGVRDQRPRDIGARQDVGVALHGGGDVVRRVVDAGDRHVLLRHLGRKLFAESVDVDEDAVQRLLVRTELREPRLACGLPLGVSIGKARGAERQQRMALEIPGGLEGIPVGFGEGNILPYQICYLIYHSFVSYERQR